MPPPLPNLLGIVAGASCNWMWPFPVGPDAYVRTFGVLLFGASLVLSVMTGRTFNRHGTAANPTRETTAIVVTGPLRFSRNPIYVAFAVIQVAVGLLFNNGWILLATVPATMVVHYVVVLKEEAYLEARFGEQYRAYKARVRRWI